MFQFAGEDANSIESWEGFNNLLDLAFNRFEVSNVNLLQSAAARNGTLLLIYLEDFKSLEFRFQSFQTLHSATRCDDLLALSMETSREGFSEPRCSPQNQNCLEVCRHYEIFGRQLERTCL
jgi:hypothetical protein